MSSFFTTADSQRKRKLDSSGSAAGPASKRRSTARAPPKHNSQKQKPTRHARDNSISGSDSEGDVDSKRADSAGPFDPAGEVSSSDDETAAEKRLRLAEQYLQSIKGTIDETGFDAEDLDRDLIAERLQEDVAETKGRLHKHITSKLDFRAAVKTQFRVSERGLSMTGIAVCEPFVYTVAKDMALVKWRLPELLSSPTATSTQQTKRRKKKPQQQADVDGATTKKRTPAPKPTRRRPVRLLSTHGQKHKSGDQGSMHHTGAILCIAASPTGQFVATGGADRKLIIWSAADLKPLRLFTQHRDAITGLAFRHSTNQLYSASKDRTIKTWSLNELAYVETLFGHQDEVLDVCAGMGERCVSVGGRDRTGRVWKVAEETQLVFRGGGMGRGEKKGRKARNDGGVEEEEGEQTVSKSYAEGSIDRVALVDEDTFVTGSDNGSISLWSVHKKKPVFTVPLAHGLDAALKPEEASAEADAVKRRVPERNPRWITALATVPNSDLVVSGSWDGEVRVWRVGEGKKSLEGLGILGVGACNGFETGIRGVVNDISVSERREGSKESLCVAVAVGTECRLGRWKKVKGGRSGAVMFEVPKLKQDGMVRNVNNDGDA